MRVIGFPKRRLYLGTVIRWIAASTTFKINSQQHWFGQAPDDSFAHCLGDGEAAGADHIG